MADTATTSIVAQSDGPWRVGERPKPSAMLPIRTNSGKAVGYAYKAANVTRARTSLRGAPPEQLEPGDVPSTAEAGFLVRVEGYCQHCAPRRAVGHLVAVLYRLVGPFVPVYRCAAHQDAPVRMEAVP